MLNVIYDKNTKKVLVIFFVLFITCSLLIFIGFYSGKHYIAAFPMAMLPNLPFILIEKGITICKEENKYRSYKSFLGLNFSSKRWNYLSQPSYISLFKIKKTKENPDGVNYNYVYFYNYQINIFDQNNAYYTLLEIDIDESEQAKEIVHKISDYLKIPILDATSQENNWVERL